MASPQQSLKVKRIVWTCAITSITAVGAIYGAGLKTQGEHKKEIRKVREATLSERISHLEQQRGALVAKRIGLEKKIKEAGMRRDGATVEESTRGMERRRGEGVRVTMEDNLKVVGMGAEVDEICLHGSGPRRASGASFHSIDSIYGGKPPNPHSSLRSMALRSVTVKEHTFQMHWLRREGSDEKRYHELQICGGCSPPQRTAHPLLQIPGLLPYRPRSRPGISLLLLIGSAAATPLHLQIRG
ncbi:hypothetical protein SBOR_8002 [Sclerotinia borealis F-4128]|uniref:Uncharacterized protein n=1 Tax=Sclerotinia borealis (strain F-4128) TaxID=1432307 RepID=W9C770_SCLBF|nr:hypothetical protein SBOR_8002 [Sclerotinia borealis F-4128]